MADRIQAIRGMNDILPGEVALWQKLEQILRDLLSTYAYQEIRFPIVESTQLFKRTIGEVTDIVEKEMYTFTDLNGESISLRPEGTASTVRACLEHGLLYNQQQRLWYLGPMFRYEKPQKGRFRQFYQLGVEAFGIEGVGIELELLLMCARLWKALQLEDVVTLEINTLGSLEERQVYRDQLVNYFTKNHDQLDEDSRRRLHRNPLRILDSKNPQMQDLIESAPRLLQCLKEESRSHFEALCQGLEHLDIPYRVNPRLVRGLDYYGHTVFEWVTDKIGSQSTVCAGGRYDALVSQLGGDATAAVGFAMGMERLLLLLQSQEKFHTALAQQPIFIVSDVIALHEALLLAEQLRDAGFPVICNTSGGSFKSQFKKADKSQAWLALIIGETELQDGTVGIKWLREARPQEICKRNQVLDLISVRQDF